MNEEGVNADSYSFFIRSKAKLCSASSLRTLLHGSPGVIDSTRPFGITMERMIPVDRIWLRGCEIFACLSRKSFLSPQPRWIQDTRITLGAILNRTILIGVSYKKKTKEEMIRETKAKGYILTPAIFQVNIRLRRINYISFFSCSSFFFAL